MKKASKYSQLPRLMLLQVPLQDFVGIFSRRSPTHRSGLNSCDPYIRGLAVRAYSSGNVLEW